MTVQKGTHNIFIGVWVRRQTMKKLFFLICLVLLFCIYPISASLTVNTVNIGTTYIEWNWSATITDISIDGLTVCKPDLTSKSFVLSDLLPNETHTIKIFSLDDNGTATTKTLSEEPSKQTQIINIVLGYIFFIASIGLILIGIRVPLMALLGSGLSIIGIVNMIGVNFWAGFVFMCIFCAGILVAYEKGE